MVSPALTFLKTSALSILYFIVIPSIQPSTFPWLTVRLLAVASTPSTFPRRVWVFLASCGWATASAANSRIAIAPAMSRAKARRAARLIIESLLKFIVTQLELRPMRQYAHLRHGVRPRVVPGRSRLVWGACVHVRPGSQLTHSRAID